MHFSFELALRADTRQRCKTGHGMGVGGAMRLGIASAKPVRVLQGAYHAPSKAVQYDD